jgi:hypothetical protein
MPVENIKDMPIGWQNNERNVYIGRPGGGMAGPWGNPFRHGPDGTRVESIAKFDLWIRGRLLTDPELKERVKALHGKTLVCFCWPKRCHGEILEALARELSEKSQNDT